MKKIFLILMVLFQFLSIQGIFAQDTQDEQEVNYEQFKFDRLKRIRKELVTLQEKIDGIKAKVENEKDLVIRLKYESEMLNLQRQYDKDRFQFIEAATNVNLDFEAQDVEPEKRNLMQEIHDLLSPALNGIRKLSEKPRQIEKAEQELHSVSEQLEMATIAYQEMSKIRTQEEVQPIKVTMRKVTEFTEQVVNELKVKKEDLEFQILKQQKLKGSVFEEVSKLILEFIKTKGKNLFLALISFVLFFWFLNMFKEKLLRVLSFKLGTGKDSEYRHWALRTVRVLYNVLNGLVSFFAGLGTLYILNDWVLVTFILITIGAACWSMSSYIPMFMEQMKLVLNIGPIREGERIVYKELPWLVKGLGFYCRIVNPALSGGDLRIHSKELLPLNSRSVQDREPWFPSLTGDWVKIADGIEGEVLLQSPEQVVIKQIGGMIKYYRTDEYIKLAPLNFTRNGFGVECLLGVDYAHQGVLFSSVIPSITIHLQKIKSEFSGIESLQIDFASADDSALTLRIFVNCKGVLAPQKADVQRRVQSLFVEACEIHKWVIPYNQMTVHVNNERH